VATRQGPSASRLVVGIIRLISDNFSRVMVMAPVREPAEHEVVASLETYPGNVEFAPLYHRSPMAWRPLTAIQLISSVPRILGAVRRVDIVHARFPHYPAMISAAIAATLGKPMLISIHGDMGEVLLQRHGRRNPLWRAVARAAAWFQHQTTRRAVLTLVVGERTRHLARGRVVPFANHQVALADFCEREDTCDRGEVKLLYAGLLAPNKGLGQLLDAVLLVRSSGVACRLTLVGAASHCDPGREIARRNLTGVDLAGPVPWGAPLFRYYRTHDIFVFPSLSEGVPKAPMEALSQSLPVVATTPGSSDYIVDEESGLLVPPGDASALARAVTRMATDRPLRRRCIQAGLAVARQHSREAVAARLRSAVWDAFGPPSAPAVG
jgi:glycosyltransferase involved in cell wall biosynthesis